MAGKRYASDSQERLAVYLRSAIWHAARKRSAQRWAAEIRSQAVSQDDAIALTAILLTELTARPVWARGIEWMVSAALNVFSLRSAQVLRRRLTVGPLQIRGGPWNRVVAVRSGLLLLCRDPKPGIDPEKLAKRWNGAAADQRQALGYVMALQVALPLAQVLIDSIEDSGDQAQAT